MLSPAGAAYVTHVNTNFSWGSQAEAHSIASSYNFKTHIFENRAGRLRLLSEVGIGAARAFSLLWTGDHYQVLAGGAALNGQVYAANMLVHDPTGDGNCMYEAMFYIVRMGNARITADLQDSVLRASHVRNMRTVAATNLDPALANILGEELAQNEAEDLIAKFDTQWLEIAGKVKDLYAAFPPATHYIARDLKKQAYHFHTRADGVQHDALSAVLEKRLNLKGKKEREAVEKHIARDRSYFSAEKLAEKPKEEAVEYPFPVAVPPILYRWCSTADARDAVTNGITKTGGVHDGIPTMPKLISKDKARGGGGVGIVSSDRCLQITTALIPEIFAKKSNSLNMVRAKAGIEYKVLVTIPAAAITDITSTIK